MNFNRLRAMRARGPGICLPRVPLFDKSTLRMSVPSLSPNQQMFLVSRLDQLFSRVLFRYHMDGDEFAATIPLLDNLSRCWNKYKGLSNSYSISLRLLIAVCVEMLEKDQVFTAEETRANWSLSSLHDPIKLRVSDPFFHSEEDGRIIQRCIDCGDYVRDLSDEVVSGPGWKMFLQYLNGKINEFPLGEARLSNFIDRSRIVPARMPERRREAYKYSERLGTTRRIDGLDMGMEHIIAAGNSIFFDGIKFQDNCRGHLTFRSSYLEGMGSPMIDGRWDAPYLGVSYGTFTTDLQRVLHNRLGLLSFFIDYRNQEHCPCMHEVDSTKVYYHLHPGFDRIREEGPNESVIPAEAERYAAFWRAVAETVNKFFPDPLIGEEQMITPGMIRES